MTMLLLKIVHKLLQRRSRSCAKVIYHTATTMNQKTGQKQMLIGVLFAFGKTIPSTFQTSTSKVRVHA